ncbi:uncharacterized protein LOC135226281 [Macrobrachium nipponense]|uniref:uncharacterized protein LOC135226281 n=1 Tax=Macrobrachium nipponense TaxID=159736 RepID=UPI0030C8640A
MIRPVLIYGAETWALRGKEEIKLKRTERRMLRWIMGILLLERLENDEIRRAGWYRHVLRMDDEERVKRAWEEPVRGRRSRGRQRIRWQDRVKEHMERRGLVQDDAFDRRQWRRRIRQPTP